MKLYLDDDSVNPLLVRLLVRDGHDVVIPADVGTQGKKDPCHFMFAIRHVRVLLTGNYKDYELLHELVLLAGGHHPGILVVRKDNDPTRDLKPKGIVHAIGNFIAASSPIMDQFTTLNHWR